MVTWIAIIAAATFVVGSAVSAWRSKRYSLKALKAAKAMHQDHSTMREALVTLIDDDGKVHLKALPPADEEYVKRQQIKARAPKAVLTPCGDMCKLSFWKESKDPNIRGWRCRADQGRSCDSARPKFVDDQGECVHWERDDDC